MPEDLPVTCASSVLHHVGGYNRYSLKDFKILIPSFSLVFFYLYCNLSLLISLFYDPHEDKQGHPLIVSQRPIN